MMGTNNLWQHLRQLGAAAQEIVFPTQCLVCGQAGHWWCQASITLPWPSCFHCRKPNHPKRRLASCRRSLPLLTIGHYDQPSLRLAIYQWKYQGHWVISQDWANLLAKQFEPFNKEHQVFVPIPLHWRRQLERGYNQAEILARQIARRTGGEVVNILSKSRRTKPQVSLTDNERLTSPVDSFRAKMLGQHQPIWLVDDVVTTGTTINESLHVLEAAGWQVVGILALAQARP